MIEAAKTLVKRYWPSLRLRTILFAVLVFAAAMPAAGAVFLRVYENTLVHQTEAELIAQGAALAAAASAAWPAEPARPGSRTPGSARDPGYYRPEPSTIDLNGSPVLPERPPVRPGGPADPAALAAAGAVGPIIDRTTQTTLASILLLDRRGVAVTGDQAGGDFSVLPEVREALAGRPDSVMRRAGDYRPRYPLEWLSRASSLRLHHARPIRVGDQVVGVLLLSRSPRALFRGVYDDRGKIALAGLTIFGVLAVLSGLVSRGVTRPIEGLSAASRDVAAGRGGDIPDTPATAAVEIKALYEDFRAMADAIERRSRYLRDLAASVSHEFKTPLTAIGGAVELLQDHADDMSDEERRRFLDNASADVRRLSHLVSRLLELARADMARPEAGASVDVRDVLGRLADAFGGPDFAVAAEAPAGLAPTAVPEAALEAVLAALIENSRQAGARRVDIQVVDAADGLRMSVRDDGPGVAAGDRERLFEPFFTSRRTAGGTGLGLPIARSLLAASHGRIVLAEGGTGACFDLFLPRAETA
ncbi:HAMP domain-containing sensor histidine kinase [Caulobacter sp. CCUG 60055]|uniref:sensor histidine kinase n=1 Tax=Caulobacter sp. CCUG 60055 TaxID=2100090 RepID=UPI001FA73DEF